MTEGLVLARVRAAYRRDAEAARPEIWIDLRPQADTEADALALDARLDAGERLPLAGTVLAVKGNMDVAGLPTTAACPGYARLPGWDAPAVARLRAAGAVVLGTTNLDQFATGLVGTRSPYGVVRNALDPTLVAGGSSAGSAVAVALGIADLALGTDTAGSGRVPAAFNGIVGIKPTYGSIPTTGVVPACKSLDCVTVFARTLAEAERAHALLLDSPPNHRPAVRAPGGLRSPPPNSSASSIPAGTPRGPGPFGNSRTPGSSSSRWTWSRSVAPPNCSTRVPSSPSATPPSAPFWTSTPTTPRPGSIRLSPPSSPRPATSPPISFSPTRTNWPGCAFRRWSNWATRTRCCYPPPPDTPPSPRSLRTPWAATPGWGASPTRRTCSACARSPSPPGTPRTGSVRCDADRPPPHEARLGAVAGLLSNRSEPYGSPSSAHTSGENRLNPQLLGLGAHLRETTTTAADYRMHALPTTPPKPGLIRVTDGSPEQEGTRGGAAVTAEIWELPAQGLGRLVAGLTSPMAIGSVRLADGSSVAGFLCEPAALDGAPDITGYGGWREYLAAQRELWTKDR